MEVDSSVPIRNTAAALWCSALTLMGARECSGASSGLPEAGLALACADIVFGQFIESVLKSI